MTATLTEAPLAGTATRPAPVSVVARIDQHVLVQEPPAGTVIQMSVGRQLVLRFRPRLGVSRWRVAERPDHLLPLSSDGQDLAFLVFDTVPERDEPGRLCLERADPHGRVHETRDLLVVPVS